MWKYRRCTVTCVLKSFLNFGIVVRIIHSPTEQSTQFFRNSTEENYCECYVVHQVTFVDTSILVFAFLGVNILSPARR